MRLPWSKPGYPLYTYHAARYNIPLMNISERQRFLSIATRRVKPGSGSGAPVLRERSAVYGAPDLRFLEARVAFVIVDGLATRLYMPERTTLDTDN